MGFRDAMFGEGRLRHPHRRHRPPRGGHGWEGDPRVELRGTTGRDWQPHCLRPCSTDRGGNALWHLFFSCCQFLKVFQMPTKVNNEPSH